jgi:hypothetical protein
VGDSNCNVWEVAAGGSPEMQVHGHPSDMLALAFHLARPNVCATVCDGSQVRPAWLTACLPQDRTAAKRNVSGSASEH